MTGATIPKVAVVGTRPAETGGSVPMAIPSHWPIYSAPRPLYGHLWQVWNAPFRTFGVFLATVCPDATDEFDAKSNAQFIEENRRLDARELVFVTEDEAFETGVNDVRAKYSGIDKIEARLEKRINDPELRQYFIGRGLESMTDDHAWS